VDLAELHLPGRAPIHLDGSPVSAGTILRFP
jgi:hypothetical protein